jgi:hypothetical protein
MTEQTMEKRPSNANPPPPQNSNTPKRRGRQPGQKIEARPPIPADEFNFIVEVDGKEQADMRRKREERTDQQKAVDELCYKLYEANVVNEFENGTIRNWPDLAVYVWRPSKKSSDTVLFYIKKACAFYGRRPIWGEIKEIIIDGKPHIEIPFTVVNRREITRRNDDEE